MELEAVALHGPKGTIQRRLAWHLATWLADRNAWLKKRALLQAQGSPVAQVMSPTSGCCHVTVHDAAPKFEAERGGHATWSTPTWRSSSWSPSSAWRRTTGCWCGRPKVGCADRGGKGSRCFSSRSARCEAVGGSWREISTEPTRSTDGAAARSADGTVGGARRAQWPQGRGDGIGSSSRRGSAFFWTIATSTWTSSSSARSTWSSSWGRRFWSQTWNCS